MIDPVEFKAPYIAIDDIRKKADEFRSFYWGKKDIPVDIFEIAEFELGIEIRTILNLKDGADVDALLLGDFKTVVVDQNEFLNDRYQNRLRFSFAHEIGHLILHRDVFSTLGYSSVDEWINFFQKMPEDQYRWIEQHANEFAGRLLVPLKQLIDKLNNAVSLIQKPKFDAWDSSGDLAYQYISQHVARQFGVSGQVIQRRLIKEKLWPPPGADCIK